jgi:hypothetical protein
MHLGKEAVIRYGYVTLVIDGSRAEKPNSRENRREYGKIDKGG